MSVRVHPCADGLYCTTNTMKETLLLRHVLCIRRIFVSAGQSSVLAVALVLLFDLDLAFVFFFALVFVLVLDVTAAVFA